LILGIGIDMIEVDRVRKAMEADPEFAKSVFAEAEMDYCETMSNKYQHYAARFCAKEAFLKALGVGLHKGLLFSQIQVVNNPQGKPDILLDGKAKDFYKKFGFSKIFVSLSHLKELAQAIVILEK
jgi:holo-[acyl-carrier protein] synthase